MGTMDTEIKVTFAENLELWIKFIFLNIFYWGVGVGGRGGGVVSLFCFPLPLLALSLE